MAQPERRLGVCRVAAQPIRSATNRVALAVETQGAVHAPPDRLPRLPDRLSTDPKSPYCDPAVLEHGIGFNRRVRPDVEERCVSEG
jgi:hypothetical protein